MDNAQNTAIFGPSEPQHTIEGESPISAIADKALSSSEAAAGSSKKAKKQGRGKASNARYKESGKEKRGGQREASPVSSVQSTKTIQCSNEVELSSPCHDSNHLLQETRLVMSSGGKVIPTAIPDDSLVSNSGTCTTIPKAIAEAQTEMEPFKRALCLFSEVMEVSARAIEHEAGQISRYPTYNVPIANEDHLPISSPIPLPEGDGMLLLVYSLILGSQGDAATINDNL
ncbi:hypothetical protein RUND412_001375 [Rhizina undulata]